MISVSYLFEGKFKEHLFESKKEHSGYKMKNVGSGYGKLIGGQVMGLPGMAVGHYIGKESTKNPEKLIDEKKKSHRVGSMF